MDVISSLDRNLCLLYVFVHCTIACKIIVEVSQSLSSLLKLVFDPLVKTQSNKFICEAQQKDTKPKPESLIDP